LRKTGQWVEAPCVLQERTPPAYPLNLQAVRSHHDVWVIPDS